MKKEVKKLGDQYIEKYITPNEKLVFEFRTLIQIANIKNYIEESVIFNAFIRYRDPISNKHTKILYYKGSSHTRQFSLLGKKPVYSKKSESFGNLSNDLIKYAKENINFKEYMRNAYAYLKREE